LSAIQDNLRELDALCRAAEAPFSASQTLQELEAQRDTLAAQAAVNNVSAPPGSSTPIFLLCMQVKLKSLIDSLRLMCENIALVAT
jgi:hypothetical protein